MFNGQRLPTGHPTARHIRILNRTRRCGRWDRRNRLGRGSNVCWGSIGWSSFGCARHRWSGRLGCRTWRHGSGSHWGCRIGNGQRLPTGHATSWDLFILDDTISLDRCGLSCGNFWLCCLRLIGHGLLCDGCGSRGNGCGFNCWLCWRVGVFDGQRLPSDHATFRHRYQLLRVLSSSTTLGRTSNRSPTTPKSATSKIGASSSLLIATMVLAVCMPARCWMAPEMPTAT